MQLDFAYRALHNEPMARKAPFKQFKKIIWDYYKKSGRDLPWRKTRDPYRILVSEMMLQQTQVDRVRPFYENFIRRFPDFASLARARTADVLAAWRGLGYNRRALFIKRLAEVVMKDFKGKLPKDRNVLESLPGIGKGTSGALSAFAFNRPEIFIETNIRRVFIHFFFAKNKKVTDTEIERYIERTLPRKNSRRRNSQSPREWYWALMDYGSMLGRTMRRENPNRGSAHYTKQSAFKGSERELRGKILKFLLERNTIPEARLHRMLASPQVRVKNIVEALRREGFLDSKSRLLRINEK